MNSHSTQPTGPRRRRRGGSRRSSPHAHGSGRTQFQAPHKTQSADRPQAVYDPEPVAFSTLGLEPSLLEGVTIRGFEKTTPIQSAVIPIALQGHDVIGCADTGTGKTVAFVLPILHRILKARAENPAERGFTRVLILAPTRELCVQIEDDVQGFTYHTDLTSIAVYGGVEMGGQERALRAGVDIVVATPGRLMDHQRGGAVNFSRVDTFVLDEADRMMDMGFWPDVRKIAEALPPTAARQTMLFSATMPDEVMRFADALAPTAVFLQVGSRRGPAQTITHEAKIVPMREKPQFLARYLRRKNDTAIVFVNTKIGCDRLARSLQQMGLRAAAIHADRSQADRTATIEAFRAGRVRVLVATDVAARGLDIDDIGLIVNYEVPHGLDSYVHRVGRTGRNETTGHALTLADPAERRDLEEVERAFGLKLLDEPGS